MAKRTRRVMVSVREAGQACAHEHVRETGITGFVGPVAREENRAAHGNICVHEECATCGARRQRLVNQHHDEIGAWGPSRAARIEAARVQMAAAQQAIAAVPALRLGDQRIELDSDGMIVGAVELIDTHPLPATWLSAAQAARRAVVASVRAMQEAA